MGRRNTDWGAKVYTYTLHLCNDLILLTPLKAKVPWEERVKIVASAPIDLASLNAVGASADTIKLRLTLPSAADDGTSKAYLITLPDHEADEALHTFDRICSKHAATRDVSDNNG